NFIDTPGHVDFGAEVDMALSAVEGAVLVVSAASGVETQTVAAFKKLRDAGVRTLLFINKLDNPDYSLDETLINIEEILGVRPVLMTLPEYKEGKICSVLDILSKSRLVHSENGMEEIGEVDADAAANLSKHYKEAVEHASNFDDTVLSMAVEGKAVPPKDLLSGLKKLAANKEYALCYAGSAMEGFGVRSLLTALSFFLPEVPDFDESRLGQVIRLRHFKGVGEISLFRSHVNLERKAWPLGFEFSRLRANLLVPVEEIRKGDIYAMRSPSETELGQILNLKGMVVAEDEGFKRRYQPLLQTRVECVGNDDFEHVEKSLSVLSRMDPSFDVEKNDGGYWVLHTVGEVQLDVLLSRLRREFGCEVRAGSPEVRYQERLSHSVGPVENSFQAGPHKISICLSAE
ncbi:MAG: GTP-binding protein, partial [Fibrobacter sp.]|nr:GTP-binding protein [Fibrobacter sp.]